MLRSREPFASSGRCALCGSTCALGDALCNPCAAELAAPWERCERCALPLTGDRVCGRCIADPPPFDRALAAVEYRSAAAWLVKRFKFSGDLVAGRALADALAAAVAPAATEVDLVVPIPLHPSRVRWRGFDQALEIARAVARAHARPLAAGAIERVRATAVQSTIERHDLRRANVRGAFRARGRALAGRAVALVDDVMTSGATAAAATAAARAAGAACVSIWICCRARPPVARR